jgi:transposase
VPRLWWVIEELVPDGLWDRVAPLLPAPKPRRHRYPGRRPIDDRAALAGIVFVLKTGITWNQLPTALVGCSGLTCWRRLRDWTEASAKRLLLRIAVCFLFLMLAAMGLGLLDRNNWREVAAGALFAWSVSGLAWAVSSYRTGSTETLQSLEQIAERDLIHARLNHLAAQLGAPLINLNDGELGSAIAMRVERHAHMSGLEEFRYGAVHEHGDHFWDNVACGYEPSTQPPSTPQPARERSS